MDKATELLSDTLVKNDYTPFTTEQATTYIKEMLAQSYPNQVITKVVLHSGLYYIYTKQGGDSILGGMLMRLQDMLQGDKMA